LPTTSSSPASTDQLQSYLEHITQHDDVFRTEFFTHILLDEPNTASSINEAVRDLASSYGSKVLSLTPRAHLAQLALGPYLIAEGSLWQVFRLYDDAQGAFMVGVEPPDSEEYDQTSLCVSKS
jgi:hypothetical protein